MTRAKGSLLQPTAGRSTGPKEKTGHRAAADMLRRGDDFKPGSLAARAEIDIHGQLEAAGVPQFLERNAVRVQVVAELHWAALVAAAQANEEKKVEDLSKRFVNYCVKASKLWAEVAEARKNMIDGTLDYERVLEGKRND